MKKYDKSTVSTTLSIAVPAMVESISSAVTSLVDSLMVSSLGANAVAAIGLTGQPKFLALVPLSGITTATTTLVARRFGEKRRDEANRIFITALTATLPLIVLISIIMYIFTPQIISFCGSEPQTHDDAVTYLRIVLCGLFLNAVQNVANSAQRGAGNTKITMRTNLTSNIVNVIFNYLLIGGNFGFPALGVKGAAIATLLGTLVAAAMSAAAVLNHHEFVSLTYILNQKMKPTIAALKNILKIGYSLFFENALMRIGLFASALMVANQGTAALAAHQVCTNILTISVSFGNGLSAAAVALVGRSLGEKNPELAKEYGRTCQMIGYVLTAFVAVLFITFGKSILSMFFKEEHIIEIGFSILKIIIFIVALQISHLIYFGCLRGAGDITYTTVIAVTGIVIIRPAIGYLLGYTLGLGINGIWLGILADHIVRYIIGFTRFKKGKWTEIKI